MADVTDSIPPTDPMVAISQGKRHLLVRDYTAAVTAFAEGLELLSQKYGDCGDELGEPYLLYGRALLGLAREEAGVLGDGVPGTEEDNEDSVEDEINESSLDKIKESLSEEKKKIEESVQEEDKIHDKKLDQKSNKDNFPSSSKDIQKIGTESSTENGSTIPTNCTVPTGDDDEDVNKDDEDDDAGRGIDLQVAWEVLELAKIVFSKRGQSGIKQLAEAHRLLGEVAMESGNPEVATTDIEKALTILLNVETHDPRSIAELHYQLGLAHSLTNDFDASINHFKEATSLLESRIKQLKNTTELSKSDNLTHSIESEIAELNELLPEIYEKITDMNDFKQEACKLVIEEIKNKVANENRKNGAGPSSESSSTSTDLIVSSQMLKPVSDISHLVRKKRKNESDVAETPCKKANL